MMESADARTFEARVRNLGIEQHAHTHELALEAQKAKASAAAQVKRPKLDSTRRHASRVRTPRKGSRMHSHSF
jgi:hypothetical protein